MPLPRSLARFNRIATNRLVTPFASHLGGFLVLHHTGRKSGRRYRTPLNGWLRDDRIVVALTYGAEVDWLKNALASESAVMVMKGECIAVGRPEVIGAGVGMKAMPGGVRLVLSALGVSDVASFPVAGESV